MVGTTLSDASSLLGGSTLASGTPTKFNPSRIQPLAGKAVNELPVVYLDLFKNVEVVINEKDSYKCDFIVTYQPKIDYEAEANLNFYDISKVVQFLCSIATESAYNFDFAKIIAYLKAYLDSTSNLTNNGTYRRCTLYANMDSISDIPDWFLNLREVIANTINCESSMPEVDYWIQREGKFIIRLLSLLIDNVRKNIGRIVIEEDPYI
jgi:hypothetical protein